MTFNLYYGIAPIVVVQAPAPEAPAPQAPAGPPVLANGAGFSGATATPAQVGTKTTVPVARWNVVPEQLIAGNFDIGVVAFHSYGVDRVEFSLNGGAWTAVNSRSVNARHNTTEYVARIDTSTLPDGPCEVRAVAYPINGQPYVLESLTLLANNGGTLVESVVELQAGTYDMSTLSFSTPSQGWHTIKAAAGVPRESVIITNKKTGLGDGHVRFKGVRLEPPGFTSTWLYGNNGGNSWIWFDDCHLVGGGEDWPWTIHNWNRSFWTDTEVENFKVWLHGTAGEILARNCNVHDLKEDAFRAFGLVTGLTLTNVDRGANTSLHPDIFDFNSQYTQRRVIFHNVTGRNLLGQGFAGDNLEDVAFVDVDCEFPGWAAMKTGGLIKNFLIQGTRLIGGGTGFGTLDAGSEEIVMRSSQIGFEEPYLPPGHTQSAVTVTTTPNPDGS